MSDSSDKKMDVGETDANLTPYKSTQSISVDADAIRNAIIGVVNAFKVGPAAKKGRMYLSVFEVNEEKIKQINTRALETLNDKRISWFPESEIEFRASVGMPDLTRKEFSEFDKFMSRGGDEERLERLELCWTRRVSNPFAVELSINISFVTEKKLDTEELGLFDYHTSNMSLTINGHDDDFVEKTFALFDPIMESCKISVFYAPLLVFRNKLIVQILSNSLSLGAMLVTQVEVGRYLNHIGNIDKSKIVDAIVNTADFGKKIDLLASQLISPAENPWWHLIVALGAGGFAFAFVLAVTLIGFPLLVPRSLINIGLLKSFNDRYQNIYKLIVVTILAGMIVVPITKKGIEFIFGNG